MADARREIGEETAPRFPHDRERPCRSPARSSWPGDSRWNGLEWNAAGWASAVVPRGPRGARTAVVDAATREPPRTSPPRVVSSSREKHETLVVEHRPTKELSWGKAATYAPDSFRRRARGIWGMAGALRWPDEPETRGEASASKLQTQGPRYRRETNDIEEGDGRMGDWQTR